MTQSLPKVGRTGPVTAIAAAIRTRRLLARDVVTLSLSALEASRATLNPWSELDATQALAAADAIDERRVPLGPLSGAPLLIKDSEHWAGHATRHGSLVTSSKAATETSLSPSRLIDAGAIAVGKSTLPEFAIEGFTANRLTGVTRNPWGVAYSPGGSSGGAGAALAAGAVAIATATDGGGSVRIPAALCGLLGLKPTNGSVGRWPAHDWIDYSTDGVLATSSDDLRLLYEIQRGPVAGDPTAPTIAMLDAVRPPDAPTRLCAAYRTSDLGPLATSVASAFEDAVAAFADLLNLPVTWVEPGSLFGEDDPDLDWFTVATAEHVASLGRDFVDEHFDDFAIATQAFFEVGRRVTLDEYLAARRRRFTYVRQFDEFLGADTVLLTPTVASPGWLADGRLDESTPLGGLPPEVYSTALQNVTGNPALSVPFGHLANGLPFGLQITAPRYFDAQLLTLADRWQIAYPWQRSAPGFTSLDVALGL